MSSRMNEFGKLPLISIIVPVYNVEDYLEECVDSILGQTYKKIEIVLVDDGSTDGCAEICDSYGIDHSNVKVIHRENGGLSAARNTGVRASHGDYIGFIDSDDYISPVFFEALYNAIAQTGVKMATMRYGLEFFDGDAPQLGCDINVASSFELLSSEEYQIEVLYQRSWAGAVWRLYTRELAEKVYFPEGLYYEDDETAYRYAHECEFVAVLNATNLYAYRQRPTSIMRGVFNRKKLESCLQITRRMRSNMLMWYPQLDDAVCSRCFAICRVVFSQIPSGDKEAQITMWNELQKYSAKVICDKYSRKREKIAALVSKLGIVPFRAFCNTYRLILKAQ